jgi:hypothetical protein
MLCDLLPNHQEEARQVAKILSDSDDASMSIRSADATIFADGLRRECSAIGRVCVPRGGGQDVADDGC